MKLIKIAEVLERISISRSAFLRWLDQPEIGFPQPQKIGHLNFWVDSQVEDWISSHAEACAAATAAAQAAPRPPKAQGKKRGRPSKAMLAERAAAAAEAARAGGAA